MTQIQAPQISYSLAAPILVSGISVVGSSTNVTSTLTTVCNTAGRGGVAVPFRVSTGYTEMGFITSGTSSQVSIQYDSTKGEVQDANGNQVYGRLSQAAGVYTLSYYSNVNGTETSYSFALSTAIDFTANYVFDLYRFPYDALIAMRNVLVDQIKYQISTPIREQLTITSNNTVPNLSYTPIAGVNFIVQGVSNPTTDANSGFSVSGTTVTFNATTAGWTLQSGWVVVATYEHY